MSRHYFQHGSQTGFVDITEDRVQATIGERSYTLKVAPESFRFQDLPRLLSGADVCTHPIDQMVIARTDERTNCKGEKFNRTIWRCEACGAEFSL